MGVARVEGVCPLPNKSAVPLSRRWFGWGLDMGGRRQRCELCPFLGNVPLWSPNPTRAVGGRRGADTPNVGTPQMGLAPLRWKQVLPLETPAIASTLQWEDGIWTQSFHVAEKVLGPFLVLCPPHAMACERFLETSATQTPSHMSWMSREASAHKPPSQPYLALPSNLWQAQLVSTSVHLQSWLLKQPHLYASRQAVN